MNYCNIIHERNQGEKILPVSNRMTRFSSGKPTESDSFRGGRERDSDDSYVRNDPSENRLASVRVKARSEFYGQNPIEKSTKYILPDR